MEINRTILKRDAKVAIKSATSSVTLITLVYLVISIAVAFLSESLVPSELFLELTADTIARMENVSGFAVFLNFAISLMSNVLQFGFILYCLNVSRYLPASFGNLFDGFAIFFKIIALYFLIGLYTALWSMLLVIPGIIASYGYRMAPFILLDNPGMSPFDCIRESKRMMVGRKSELFVLDFSFSLWILPCIIPFFLLWVIPYMQVTYSCYYNALLELSGRRYDSSGEFIPGGGNSNTGGGYNSYDRYNNTNANNTNNTNNTNGGAWTPRDPVKPPSWGSSKRNDESDRWERNGSGSNNNNNNERDPREDRWDHSGGGNNKGNSGKNDDRDPWDDDE